MKRIQNILLLGGSFSGVTASLKAGLQARGYRVYQERPSLRRLRMRPLLLAAMAVDSLASYGLKFKQYLLRTRTSNWAFGLATERTIEAYEGIDMVVQIGANHAPFARHKRSGVVYTLYTDHTNLLSKQLPDLGLHVPERYVSSTWNMLERRNLLDHDHIFTVGAHVRRSMVEDYGIPAERVTAIGAGPNQDLDIERDRFVKTPGAKNVLFVGLEAERKGLPTLKRAFAKVREKHPDAVLHVVGVDGVDGDGVIHYGKLHGEPLKQRFYEAQIFAMPTRREPFGIVFLEAMWAKAVCIGTDIGAIPEIIADGETGYIVEPNDVDAIAERIVRLLDHPELRASLAEAGYAAAKRKRSWDLVVSQMMEAAHRALN